MAIKSLYNFALEFQAFRHKKSVLECMIHGSSSLACSCGSKDCANGTSEQNKIQVLAHLCEDVIKMFGFYICCLGYVTKWVLELHVVSHHKKMAITKNGLLSPLKSEDCKSKLNLPADTLVWYCWDITYAEPS